MRRLLHFTLPALLFLLGLGAGSWFSITRRAAAFSAGVEQRLAQGAAASTTTRGAETARTFSSEEDMLTAVMSAVSEKEPLLRAHRIHGVIGHLESAQLAVLFERTLRVDDSGRRAMVLQALFTRWAAIDFASAAAAVRPYRDRFRALAGIDWRSLDTAVSNAWAQAQPDTALAEAMATPDAPWAQSTAWSAMEALAEGDPARQLGVLAAQPPSRLRDEMCERAINALAGKDFAAAEARIDLIENPRGIL